MIPDAEFMKMNERGESVGCCSSFIFVDANRRRMKQRTAKIASAVSKLPGKKTTLLLKMVVLCIVLSFALLYLFSGSEESRLDWKRSPIPITREAQLPDIPDIYTYEIVENYPHDHKAFTQGLQFQRDCIDDNHSNCSETLLESTGQYGWSTTRRIEIETGKVIKNTKLERKYFGEGLTRFGNHIYQLTWRKPTVFVYDLKLNMVDRRRTPLSDGWGLTTDDRHLIATDGGSRLYWLDPKTLHIDRNVTVKDDDREVLAINELEWINGTIWANVWMTECIAMIEPKNGKVTGWLVLHGLTWKTQEQYSRGHHMDVLNGIAYDAEKDRLFVTGKYWPRLYEIKMKKMSVNDGNAASVRRQCILRKSPL